MSDKDDTEGVSDVNVDRPDRRDMHVVDGNGSSGQVSYGGGFETGLDAVTLPNYPRKFGGTPEEVQDGQREGFTPPITKPPTDD